MIVRIGTRKSRLARVQSETVASQLEAAGLKTELVLMESLGDIQTRDPLYAMEGAEPGVFTKQLEQALLLKKIDLAVHSLKDLPTYEQKDLKLAAVSKRATTADTLLVHPNAFDPDRPLSLKKGARIGTSSLRRQAQLAEAAPEATSAPMRGNVPTRVQKVIDGEFDGAVLAKAGLERLGMNPSELREVPLEEERFVPAPGQGALGLQTHSTAAQPLLEALSGIHDAQAAEEVRIERTILNVLEGGCSLPLGVRCWALGKTLKVCAFLGITQTTSEKSHPWIDFKRWTDTGEDAQTMIDRAVSALRQ